MWSENFGLLTAMGFVVGAAASAIAGYVGMIIAVRANVRTAQAASDGLNPALQIAFKWGAVTGLLLIGLGLVALAGFYAIGPRWRGRKKPCTPSSALGSGQPDFGLCPGRRRHLHEGRGRGSRSRRQS